MLSKEFVRKERPMGEMHILLQRWRAKEARLVPVLYNVTWEQVAPTLWLLLQMCAHQSCCVVLCCVLNGLAWK